MDNEEESQNLNEPASTELANANVKSDTDFDGRLLYITAVIGLIWMTRQIGLSFQDFDLVVQETLDTASWLFTIYNFGYMTGSLGGGLLYDHFNKRLVLALATLILAVTTVSLPWCRWFTLMLAVRFVSGLGAGALDTGVNAHAKYFLDENAGVYIVSLQILLSTFEKVLPVATEPVLPERSCQYLNFTESVGNQSHANLTFTGDVSNNATGNECKTAKLGEKIIHPAYLHSSALIIIFSIPFAIYVREILKTFQSPTEVVTSDQLDKKKEVEQRTQIIMSKKARILILVMICLFIMVNCAVESTFSSFLTTFYIRFFEWTKATSIQAKLFFWMAFLAGRFLITLSEKMFKPVNLLLSYSSLLIIAIVGVVIACLTSITIILLVSICLAGFSMSLIFPSVYSWTEESMPVTGKISSFFVIAGSIGLIINPVVLGYLMEKMTPLWFVYLLLGESCFSLILLFVLLTLVNFFKQSEESETVDADDGAEMVPLQNM